MKETTLCYIKNSGKYLMLYRNKKKNDPNAGKWIGIGGKVEAGEDYEECMLREVREETGIELSNWKYRGIVDFSSDVWDDERMHLYTAETTVWDVSTCNEGILKWIDESEIEILNLWEGDKVFLKLILDDAGFFTLTLRYKGDCLQSFEVKDKNSL